MSLPEAISRQIRAEHQPHASELFKRFRKANPHLLISTANNAERTIQWLCRRHYNSKAGKEIQAKIKKAPRTLDHGVFLRLSGVRGSRLIVSHPYGHWGVDELEDVGLAYIDGGKERSWYNPGRTPLFVVGQPNVLADIDLTYKVQ